MRTLGVSIIVLEEDHEVVSHKCLEANNLPDDVAEKFASRIAKIVEMVGKAFSAPQRLSSCQCDVKGCHARCNEERRELG